ncbi:zinc-binding dehydrogenase [Streptomyces lavendulae]|uniref:zinc-binding dehydrogenase n=1 Tax=Streptomyces lavendulae TaxID=1914 RepID=UPI0033FC23FE
MFEHGKVTVGQRVLVNGAGGGVGGFVTQLAKHAGAEVIATASPRSTEAVRRQGADQVTPIEPAADTGVSAMHMVARNDVAHLAALVELVDAAALSIDISESRPLADLADIPHHSETGRTRGKVVIIP